MKFHYVYMEFFISKLCKLHIYYGFIHIHNTCLSGKSRLHEHFKGEMKSTHEMNFILSDKTRLETEMKFSFHP